ncbi:hypothetical protein QNK09_12050 [Brevibacillus agri]|uniref:hypothetical protein n=1 Tax=Brevibacillus agri TaxID=51101 RepID=UPI000471CB57|nr:hypothetical protein [Brevibacillus agri]WHX32887.1 hypothetical protein QNK09_12050 [Brevibacillus agri]
MTFKIQIPNAIVRNPNLESTAFVVLAKLIQIHSLLHRPDTITFDYSKVMNDLCIKENRTFKSALKNLFEQGYILDQIERLPRKSMLAIRMNKNKVNPSKEGKWTQLPITYLHRVILQKIGHIGFRLLYYYESYIYRGSVDGLWAYPSIDTIAADIGITQTTVKKYNKLLHNEKFIKIDTFEVEGIEIYDENNVYRYTLDRYHNKYSVEIDRIEKLYDRLLKAVV